MRNKGLIVLLSVVAALVIIVVASGATFLVRHVEAYNYYGNNTLEGEDINYDDLVIGASGIKKNSSMFFLDEANIKSNVENAYSNVEVINVERKFPDRVSVNYVVHERMYQYSNNGMYYYCYASGRIGGASQSPFGDVFTLKTKDFTSESVGAYFQSAGGYDRKIVDAYIAFMRSKGVMDRQICSSVKFIDLTRDGYIYLRMQSGCSIEINGSADDFTAMLERGWNIFVDTKIELNKVAGLIRVWKYRGGDEDELRSSYIAPGAEIGLNDNGSKKYYYDDSYYAEYYAV